MVLPRSWYGRLSLPVVAAPMTDVSGPELVIAACRSGVIGAFPTHNAGDTATLHRWLEEIEDEIGTSNGSTSDGIAPYAANLVVHRSNERLADDVDCLVRHGVELVVTSVGSPSPVVGRLHDAGCTVFSDVASLRHVDRAAAAGVDGLVLLSAGAGGQTGWANPIAFVRAVRERFEGTVVLAGGIADGASVLAAEMLGADLAYMGTSFIATRQSLAGPNYQQALVSATLDDVTTSSQPSGLPANFLTTWLEAWAGRDAGVSDTGDGYEQHRLLKQRDVWAAGHSVSLVHDVSGVEELVARLRGEYEAALGLVRDRQPTPTSEARR